MKITRYVQSTIAIEEDGELLLIDPGKYNFEPGRYSYEDFGQLGVDILILTHRHADHFDLDAVTAIYRASSPKVFTVGEIAKQLADEGIEAQVLSPGQKVSEGPFAITAVETDHVVTGEKVDAIGVVIEARGRSVYHTSDTMYLEEKPTADVVFVPINNRGVSMSIQEAAKFVRDIKPRLAVPVHYHSPKDRHIDPQDFVRELAGTCIETKVMEVGEILEI